MWATKCLKIENVHHKNARLDTKSFFQTILIFFRQMDNTLELKYVGLA